MLTDKGLQTAEQIKAHEEFFQDFLTNKQGCIGARICKGCNHLIQDSLCLCSGFFKCPNCGHENGGYSTANAQQLKSYGDFLQIPFNVGTEELKIPKETTGVWTWDKKIPEEALIPTEWFCKRCKSDVVIKD